MLVFPIVTASIERVFSIMIYAKNNLRNNMNVQLLNDSLVTFIEKKVFLQVLDDDIINRFPKMKTHRTQWEFLQVFI